ncbi:PREDICTED: adenylate cyclase type 9 [Vollenhovia emeryi]|uniref:adenylate cyclase type 9 n=1 Tax=Vollenhovia emeryi TaxID=411798 RepID=UPI0005F57690|nr:PREDICTED: adenylate cyclase type 9 [Vollenhovia emeryi]XP_011872785.1 PREDICTED: adenylate cyclase type 9 [Vollenhovia emeryi]XP_011872786.1 PREDICTED: adenylate cyclase type 9 [Vollenhovia emeryi]
MTPELNRKRGSSVSFTRAKDDSEDAEDEIHISLAPYIQTYLAHSGQGLGCCGVSLPVPFERAAPRSWWNPRFDSEILEEQFRRSAFPQIRLRFRYALTYILLVSLSWLVYFVIIGIENDTSTWTALAGVFGIVGVLASAVLYLTHTDYYKSYVLPISLGAAATLCLLSLLFLALVPPHVDGLTLVGHFALCSEILLVIYTVLPMPLYACVGISTLYSFMFEFLTAYLYGWKDARQRFYTGERIVQNDTSGINRMAAGGERTLVLTHSSLRDPLNVAGLQNVIRNISDFTTAISAEAMSRLRQGRDTMNAGARYSETVAQRLHSALSDTNVLTRLNPSVPSVITAVNSTVNSSPIDNYANLFADDIDFSTNLAIRILMQICIHLIGVHILIMTFVRMRGTFMKVGQSLLVRRQLEMEKQLKEKMIHSVMPPKVADWLMEESEREREREDSLKKGSIPSNNTDIRSLFRPFNMLSMEDVSILFADIVGFTRMSSNKTAEELVGILNDLFERFDDLCEHHGCEKISTLGDCYYCVSGCPEPRSDHAKCCIEMGLAMIEAIKQFDVERREGVNMRVGVHTGTVLCGIVGTKRFKFDVWSNDVTLANKLESTGKPGRVHLSENTLRFLGDQYITEIGEVVNGVKTYFIRARKSDFVNQFITNVTSPKSISPLMQSRNRLASCNTQAKPRYHYLHMVTNASNYRMKANSLPSILDSENDGIADEKEDSNKSPTSTASYGKRKVRNKPWRYLQRQRTTEEMTPLEIEEGRNIAMERAKPDAQAYEECNGFRRVPVNNGVEMDPNPVPSSPLLSGQEPISNASSICSRKDSGIKSNSRRSSIQQQLFLMNGMTQGDLLGHRVSGYYTSSSTLNSTHEPSSSVPPYPFPPMVTDTFGACFHKLRKQSDLQLIRCVQDNVSSQRSYFVKPPLSSVTLFFKNKEMEKEYRENAHKASEGMGGNPPTLATSRFNTYFDILISALVYTAITISLFLLCKPTVYYTAFSVLATAVQVIAVSLCIRQLLYPNTAHATFTQRIFKFFSRWYPWHVCGAVLVGLPIISILLSLTCNSSRSLNNFEYYYSYLIFVGLVHFCNFTQLNCWMKNLLVTLTGILFICLVVSHVSPYRQENLGGNNRVNDSQLMQLGALHPNFVKSLASELNGTRDFLAAAASTRTQSPVTGYTGGQEASPRVPPRTKYNERLYNSEIYLDMVLLLLLVWFLNREFEISYRLCFHGNAVAARDKTRVQSMKNQADWLLHNIIPKYVADQLKTTAKYSQNHKSVGIIFASIVNFNELYDESYLGGKEYLRVLNELIGDFDELLERPEYANVEKIKTIGSTFMAASGLNPQVRQQSEHEYTHLFQLLDFAVAMHKVIYDFNRDLLGFKLILRIGFNYGDVTAGVIGATKLYYDIWGDAVNIASRMDSTGVAGRIQMASNCLDVLSERYEFEPRGQVYVKGKDNMDVFLLRGKRNADTTGT